ncbi:helix-turn-helix domain-containing protein [Maribacter sp. LLG6340-A2]|uniref:helix-turn-helix domain-containing protein n=1 Tax=Maribacter sp. LLG6340-A2 TaxID=3160834 RepID=UPI00386CB385
MEFNLAFDPDKIVFALIAEIMGKEAIEYEIIDSRTIKIASNISKEHLALIKENLGRFSIELKSSNDLDLVEDIKLCVREMVRQGNTRNIKMSERLTEQLGFSYSYLSNQFSSQTYTSIENFYILVRIEKVKEMVLLENAKLSEIAYELNFSSVPHLSNQFKKVTGLTITQYLKFKKKKEKNSSTNT